MAGAEARSNLEMGASKNKGTPKWMVYNGKLYYCNMDDLGVPLFSETLKYLPADYPDCFCVKKPDVSSNLIQMRILSPI